ncbi:hypothetical protein H4R21_005050, partial [Coemansia helicoidea]
YYSLHNTAFLKMFYVGHLSNYLRSSLGNGTDVTIITEPNTGEGRPNIVLTLNLKRGYRDPLVVVIETKYIPDS